MCVGEFSYGWCWYTIDCFVCDSCTAVSAFIVSCSTVLHVCCHILPWYLLTLFISSELVYTSNLDILEMYLCSVAKYVFFLLEVYTIRIDFKDLITHSWRTKTRHFNGLLDKSHDISPADWGQLHTIRVSTVCVTRL